VQNTIERKRDAEAVLPMTGRSSIESLEDWIDQTLREAGTPGASVAPGERRPCAPVLVAQGLV